MIYDITPPVSEALAVWPGDTRPTREILMDMKAGASLTLSTLRATVHLGAHADAPSHYGRDAETIESRRLDLYVGPCQVIQLEAARGARIEPRAFASRVRSERVLVATGTYPDPNAFSEDFASFAPATIDALHERGVRLVGIDTPSVDPFSSKDLEAHRRFLAHDMAILEGLVLRYVPEGMYELIALPLKLVGFDASPVRAILRTPG
jgi:arylformamidase